MHQDLKQLPGLKWLTAQSLQVVVGSSCRCCLGQMLQLRAEETTVPPPSRFHFEQASSYVPGRLVIEPFDDFLMLRYNPCHGLHTYSGSAFNLPVGSSNFLSEFLTIVFFLKPLTSMLDESMRNLTLWTRQAMTSHTSTLPLRVPVVATSKV